MATDGAAEAIHGTTVEEETRPVRGLQVRACISCLRTVFDGFPAEQQATFVSPKIDSCRRVCLLGARTLRCVTREGRAMAAGE